MKKGLFGFTAVIMAIIVVFCYVDNKNTEINHVTTEYISGQGLSQNDYSNVNNNIYSSLGMGFNLGNSLDVCDWSYFGSGNSSGFQAAIVYNTDPWTTWDASDYKYFDSNDKLTLSWNLSDLVSDADCTASNFSIQLVNHNDIYEGTRVTCKVDDAKLIYANGISVNLTTGASDIFNLSVRDDVTEFFSFDLRNFRIKTSDLQGANVVISLSISNYYDNTAEKISDLEKSWGNPLISENMIKMIKEAGFKTIRVPVTYFNHISEDGTIDDEFLDRVEEVVDWVIDNDMYCITDIQHDTGNSGWIKASKDNYLQNKEIVYYIIKQIADRFKNKSKYLILEGFNEVVNDEMMWADIPAEDLSVMNDWNQLFVDAVRSTGGGNSDRYLLINTYAALPSEEVLSSFVLPSDKVANRLFVGIHCYFNLENIEKQFLSIEKYSSKYKFIIGEWAVWKNNTERKKTVETYLAYFDKLHTPALWWDNGNINEMSLLNRNNLEWSNQNLVDMLTGR